MGNIYGTSIVGILVATLAFYGVGVLVYGVFFNELWLELSGIVMDPNEKASVMSYVWGLLITLMQVVGLSYVLQMAGARALMPCLRIGVTIAALIVLPVLAYGVVYEGNSFAALMLDFGHIVVGYALACMVMSYFRGRPVAAA